MEQDWVLIYRADEEYQAEIIRQLLEDSGLHPVIMDRKDDEFRIGQVEVYISPLESGEAKKIIASNQKQD